MTLTFIKVFIVDLKGNAQAVYRMNQAEPTQSTAKP